MKRLAPWQRNMIAMAHGITLKPSGQMEWMANVLVLGDDLPGGRRFAIWPIVADYEMEAATTAANNVAAEIYGAEGRAAFVNPQDSGRYMATVGVYQGFGLTQGRSLDVHVERITND